MTSKSFEEKFIFYLQAIITPKFILIIIILNNSIFMLNMLIKIIKLVLPVYNWLLVFHSNKFSPNRIRLYSSLGEKKNYHKHFLPTHLLLHTHKQPLQRLYHLIHTYMSNLLTKTILFKVCAFCNCWYCIPRWLNFTDIVA